MSDQILSQEEIDALYSAMSDGKVEGDGESDDKDDAVRLFDLGSQQTKLRESFDVLDEVHDKFSRLLGELLSDKLRGSIESDFISTEVMKYGEFMKGFARPTNFNIFNMDPFSGSALLVLVDTLIFAMIDRMFGGTGKVVKPPRDFTMIEQRVTRRLTVEILKQLESAWEIVHSVRLVHRKIESNPDYVQIMSPEDLIIVATFVITGGEFTGNVYVAVPYLMLEPIKEKLTYRKHRASAADREPDPLLRRMIGDMEIDLSAELGACVLTIRELLELKKGDVLPLNTSPDAPIPVKIEGVTKYLGYPGTSRGNRAVQITASVRKF